MKSKLLALALLVASPSFAADYQAPDLGEYFASLMQPDNQNASCCGYADAYQCTEDQDPDGALVCVITDTRPDERRLPDGRLIVRPHREVGSRIRIPPQKIRKHPIPNPTETAIVFVSISGVVYCYEPLAGI